MKEKKAYLNWCVTDVAGFGECYYNNCETVISTKYVLKVSRNNLRKVVDAVKTGKKLGKLEKIICSKCKAEID